MDTTNDTTKRCSKGIECKNPEGPELPATTKFFYRDKNKADGLRAECKACTAKMLNVEWKHPTNIPAVNFWTKKAKGLDFRKFCMIH